MGQIFKEKPLKAVGIFQKLAKKEPVENAFIELNNLLASEDLKNISSFDVNAISSKYKIDFHQEFSGKLKELYGQYLSYCLTDNKLSDEEIEDLKKLKFLLTLKDRDIEEIHNQIAGAIYKKSFEEVIKAGQLGKEGEKFLEKLEQDLKISKALATKIADESRLLFVQSYVKKITANQKLSPDEHKEMEEISNSLNIKPGPDSRKGLDKMKLYWLIENGQLPPLEVDISLQKGENCFFKTEANWHELANTVEKGSTGGIQITKGHTYRVGNTNSERIGSGQLPQLDSGRLYVTDKRLIFAGQKKNVNIKLDKISFTPYSDGIIVKDSGQTPVFVVQNDADILSMTLSRVINGL